MLPKKRSKRSSSQQRFANWKEVKEKYTISTCATCMNQYIHVFWTSIHWLILKHNTLIGTLWISQGPTQVTACGSQRVSTLKTSQHHREFQKLALASVGQLKLKMQIKRFCYRSGMNTSAQVSGAGQVYCPVGECLNWVVAADQWGFVLGHKHLFHLSLVRRLISWLE